MRGVTQQVVIAGFKGLFQPALPMRGVTRRTAITRLRYRISTRTPHAGSDDHVRKHDSALVQFQPALPMRGVTSNMTCGMPINRFQPALPMRGVTPSSRCTRCPGTISTRTPHAGSDPVLHGVLLGIVISTRTPHAGSDGLRRCAVTPKN